LGTLSRSVVTVFNCCGEELMVTDCEARWVWWKTVMDEDLGDRKPEARGGRRRTILLGEARVLKRRAVEEMETLLRSYDRVR
jgi:hypothetical protein